MELIKCPQGCNRSFKKEYITKHMLICKDVFQSKRFQFITQLKRMDNANFSQKEQILKAHQQTEINTPRIVTKKNLEGKVFCRGCLREFNTKIAEEHITKCVQRQDLVRMLRK